MKENLPMFGVLNYVFVAVTQFESLNDTILIKFWVGGAGKVEINHVSFQV